MMLWRMLELEDKEEIMHTYWDKIVKILSAIAGGIAGLLGGWDTMLMVLAACMLIDYVTGWIVAIMGKSKKSETGHLDSNIGFIGILKKGLILLMVLLGAMLDKAIGQQNVFRSMVVWFYVANEGLSILENMALAGMPFPAGVKKALEQLKSKNDEPPDESKEY